jgi:hypothetical protein
MPTPRIVELIRIGATLSDLQATAGRLWLAYGGAKSDSDGAIAAAIAEHWRSRPGKDPYWDFLAKHTTCSACGETRRYEDLSICPNCFNTYCFFHNPQCVCGFVILG